MTKANEVKTSLKDAVSAAFAVSPNEHAPEGAEELGGIVYKGAIDRTDGQEKTGFQAVINGVAGRVAAQFGTAINNALTANNVVPANYDRPKNWSAVAPKNEKEPEISSVDELPEQDAKAFRAGYSALEKALDKVAKKEGEARAAAFNVAAETVRIRSAFDNKAKWALFKKLSAGTAVAGFLGKNAVGEAYRAGKLLAMDGFDAETMLPGGVTGNKGVCTAYSGVIGAVAHNAVQIIRSEAGRKALGIAKDAGDCEALRVALDYLAKEGFALTEAGDQRELEGDALALAGLVIPAHIANIPERPAVFIEGSDGKFAVAKGDSGYMAAALTGLEGPDELLSAIARTLSAHVTQSETAAAVASVSDALDAVKDTAKERKEPFAAWDVDTAARHLVNMLFAGWNPEASDEDVAASVERIDGILAKMQSWSNAIIEDQCSVSDLLDSGVDLPETADEAEADGDAALAS